MNKYQKALSSIVFTLHLRVKPKTLGKCEDENLETLQELVDIYPEYLALKERATPKKVIRIPTKHNVIIFQCPKCFIETQTNFIRSYCGECGQALDWRDKNE